MGLKLTNLQEIFETETKLLALVDDETIDAAIQFEQKLIQHQLNRTDLKKKLYRAISRKLKINEEKNKSILALCAKKKILLNYFDKKNLLEALDSCNYSFIPDALLEEDELSQIIKASKISFEDLREKLKAEMVLPLNRRTKIRDKSLIPLLITSIYSDFVFNSVPSDIAKTHFLGWSLLAKDYFDYASHKLIGVDSKKPSMAFITSNSSKEKTKLMGRLQLARSELRNHSFITCILAEDSYGSGGEFWRAIEQTILFGEKGSSSKLDYKFIRREKLAVELMDSKFDLKFEDEDLNKVFGELYYMDTYYIDNSCIKESNYAVITFEVNRYDETPIPCPSCHSKDVEGNSYSKLAVKSWECKNLLCSDRSRSNRGKRFSFYSELRQSSLLNRENLINQSDIKNWNRDVVTGQSFSEIVGSMSSFYSMSNDVVCWLSDFKVPKELSRTTYNKRIFSETKTQLENVNSFRLRYTPIIKRNDDIDKSIKSNNVKNHKLFLADSSKLMQQLDTGSIDAAVTSPPYYNAKDYSQWPNVYLYYADMILNASHVSRVLKKGGVYFYNIFNYFDNERDIVLSAMGKKRLVLSSVLVDSFKEIGLDLVDNIVWDKGHIEGKRGFNNGNFGPFHQQPFNCWEHILIFSKGTPNNQYLKNLPKIFHQKPYYKMVKGKNILGHTAPFPLELPSLLTSRMSSGETVLDPYGGSGTTALAAEKDGINSKISESNKTYYNLALDRIKNSQK